jgi:hypothetical protein
VDWIRDHATSERDIVQTFPGSQRRYLASEEVDAEIAEAMLDMSIPADLRQEWESQSTLKVNQKAALLGRLRTHLNPNRPRRPLPQKQIENMSAHPQVELDIASTMDHPLMSTDY